MRSTEKDWNLKGVLTVELSYLFILLFSIFVMIIHMVFYYHDKNILMGAAYETAVLWTQLERRPDEIKETAPEDFYRERISGKLILFSEVNVEVNQMKDTVDISAFASKGRLCVQVHGKSEVAEPEKKIRQKRAVEKLIEQKGDGL